VDLSSRRRRRRRLCHGQFDKYRTVCCETTMTDQNTTEQQQQQQQCTIDSWTNDDFLGQPSGFQNTAAIEFVHDRIPRFGHTSNITEFIFDFVSDGEEQSSSSQTHSYLTGVVVCCVAFAAITTFWILVLLICRFTLRDSSRSGSWLSGRCRPLPPRPRPKAPPKPNVRNRWDNSRQTRRQRKQPRQ